MKALGRFERFTRATGGLEGLSLNSALAGGTEIAAEAEEPHPFESRNIHPDLPAKVRALFDDGHWEESVFQAFKFIENEVRRLSGLAGKTGYALMMDAFNENNALIKINALSSQSEIDEQKGYRSMFAGASTGIRNPRGHEVDLGDTLDEALDYLAFASLLLRRLDAAGLR